MESVFRNYHLEFCIFQVLALFDFINVQDELGFSCARRPFFSFLVLYYKIFGAKYLRLI